MGDLGAKRQGAWVLKQFCQETRLCLSNVFIPLTQVSASGKWGGARLLCLEGPSQVQNLKAERDYWETFI